MAEPPRVSVGLSPVEVFHELCRRKLTEERVPHVIVGPLSSVQQEEGAIALAVAGRSGDMYVPTIRPRFQLRCVAPSLAAAEAMSEYAAEELALVARETAYQESNGETYLIHSVRITGPSTHFDSETTWEGLLFAEVFMGSTPV